MFFAVLPAVFSLSAIAQVIDPEATGLAAPLTVSDAVFRSRWIGLQVDAAQRRSSAAGMLGLKAEPGPLAPLEGIANTIRDGLKLGPLDIHPGLGLGWEYSNTSLNSQSNTPSSNSSFFVSPNIALSYTREIGNWNVRAAYGGGFNYYLNPNYTAAGVGNQRNPFYNTLSLGLGYLGSRQKIDLQVQGSYGSGFNVLNGTNTATANLSSNLHWEYILTTYTNVGAYAAYTSTLNSFFQNSNTGSNSGDSASVSGGAYADWFATGKTRLRLDFSAGENTQSLGGGQSSSSSANRSYAQILLSLKYKITEKFDVGAGLGVRDVKDGNTVDPKYAGILPSYTLNVSYRPTEKTGISAGVSLVGANVRPSFNLTGSWQPRVNTGLSFSVYQGQGFSGTVAEQVQVSRGAVINLTEKLFSKIDVGLSAGWEQTENLSLSNAPGAQQNSGNTSSYGFAMGTMQWRFAEWAYWQGQLYYASGNNNTTAAANTPETRVTISFNLAF